MNTRGTNLKDGVVLGDVEYSLQALDQRSSRLAGAMSSAGVRTGDSVAVLMRNDVAFVEASMASTKLGASAVPINYHASLPDVAHIISDSAARLLVGHSDLLERVKDVVPPELSRVEVMPSPSVADAFALPERSPDPNLAHWEDWAQNGTRIESTSTPQSVSVVPDTLTYTSGTTGRPKGVRRIVRTPPPKAAEQLQALGYGANLRHLVTGPLYHAAPNVAMLGVLRQGGLAVIMPRFDPVAMLESIQRYRIEFLVVVPTMFIRLLGLPAQTRQAYDLSSLRRVLHTAGLCPPAVKEAMIAWFGPVIYETYGGTEAGAATICSSEDALSHPGTVGRPSPGVTIKILDDDDHEAPAGTIGNIYVKNDGMPDFEYVDNPTARREVERDGFITQGDCGYVDDEGYLYLAGRKREMIVSGGVNIYAAEIEQHLATMPGISASAAFAVPDFDLGEVVGVAVELDGSAVVHAAAVTAYVELGLGRLKAPRVVEFSDELTQNDMGKIFKLAIKAKYWPTPQPSR